MVQVISIHKEGVNIIPNLFTGRVAVKTTDLSVDMYKRLAPGTYSFKQFPSGTPLLGPNKKPVTLIVTAGGVQWKQSGWGTPGCIPGFGVNNKPLKSTVADEPVFRTGSPGGMDVVTFTASNGKIYTCRQAGAGILKKRLADLAAAQAARAEAEAKAKARREAYVEKIAEAQKSRGLDGLNPDNFAPLPPKVANRLEKKAKKAKKTNA
jgi:hypothetical protein